MTERDEKEWLQRFTRDLEKLEELDTPQVPEARQLLHTLNQFKEARARASKRELIVFVAAALLILGSYALMVLKLEGGFLWIQSLALLFIPAIYLAERRRRRSRGEVTRQ
ncbi:DUF5345 family protein [Paenibacillus caui]|uniref:DUF5345 family protein n=1 Tax=Paenibacillus caui TaxID=2873927 RepID=UPI001CA986A4|nr:DUF5345 family protein [Paenibacillus caui]